MIRIHIYACINLKYTIYLFQNNILFTELFFLYELYTYNCLVLFNHKQ